MALASSGFYPALADEPRVMFERPATIDAGSLRTYQEPVETSFPNTSKAPLKWRARSVRTGQDENASGALAQANENGQAANTAAAGEAISAAPATMLVDGQVRPVAFTIDATQAKASVSKPRIRTIGTGGMKSVLSNRSEPERAVPQDEQHSSSGYNSASESNMEQLPATTGSPSQPLHDPFGDRLPSARIPYAARAEAQTTSPENAVRGGALLPPPLSGNASQRPAERGDAASVLSQNVPKQSVPDLGSPRATEPTPDAATQLDSPFRARPDVQPQADGDESAPAAPGRVREPADTTGTPPSIQPRPESRFSDDNEFRAPPPAMAADSSMEESTPDDASSSRTYNQRDCEEDDRRCLDLKNRIRSDSIRKFTRERLDITAPYDPEVDTPDEKAESARLRSEKFSRAGSRQWKDKRGNVLAEGQLVELRNKAAVIKTADGQEVPVSIARLGEDEICFLAAWYNLPPECSLHDREGFQGRQFVASTFTWKASSLCHKPLYFQETQLERYGHTAGPVLQPVLSGAHFFANIATLPYHMAINPPNECQYVLGYYRPGNCAPWMIPPVPLSVRGGLAQAGFVTGLGAVIP